jgi:hypothetical protein
MDQAQREKLATQLALSELHKADPKIDPDQRSFVYEEAQWYQTKQNVMARYATSWDFAGSSAYSSFEE